MSIGTTKNITRTVLSSILHSCYLLNKDLKIYDNSTLNQKFDIKTPGPGPQNYGYELQPTPDASGAFGYINGYGTPNAQVSQIQAIVAGMGGHRMVMGPDGLTPMTQTVQHRSTDFSLFRHTPMALKDIAAGEDAYGTFLNRNNYCLRKVITFSGKQYAAYYGLKVDTSAVETIINQVHVEDNEIVSNLPFVFDAGHLAPTIPDIPNDDLVIADAEYIAITSLMEIIFNEDVATEYRNAAEILYGTSEMAICSEMGIVTGYKQRINIGDGINYDEIYASQIITHMCNYQSLSNSNAGFRTTLKLGATEPILATSTI